MADLVEMTCPICGVHYGLERRYYDHRNNGATDARGKKLSWHCPNGHSLIFTESVAEKLRRERDRLAQRVAEKDDEIALQRKQLIASKGQVTRLQKRAKAGTCPCCNRTFSNMARHMQTKHPEFDPANVGGVNA